MYTNVSVSSTAGALDDFDKTSVPPVAPEAPTDPDAGAKSNEKVINILILKWSQFMYSIF